MGSVSQIGWEWYSRLSDSVDVTLLTHTRNRAALISSNTPLKNSNILFIDTEWFAGPLYRFAEKCFPRSEHPKFLIASLDFFVYDWLAVKKTKQLLKLGTAWDIVHAVTPVSPLAASRLHQLGIPLVLGPWNGGLVSPTTFPEIMKSESKWLYPIRNLSRLLDFFIGSTRHAALILTATQSTLASIPFRYHAKCRFMLENAVDLNLFKFAPWPKAPSITHPLHIVFVGRLLSFKGIAMLLEAIASLDFPVFLTVVGDGAERERLIKLTDELGIVENVLYTGNLPLNEIAQIMKHAHVFCLPSIRESGGAVLLEAMAVGRPVIAINFGGPAEIVDEGVGVKLPATGKNAVIEGLIKEFKNIIQHPKRWEALGIEGRRRAENTYSWDIKMVNALAIYHELIKPNS